MNKFYMTFIFCGNSDYEVEVEVFKKP